jgi:thymidylate kinase
MLASQRLEQMLTQEIAPDLENYIDELFEKIADTKQATQEDKDELKQAQELQSDFKQMYDDLQDGEMDEDECQELLDELIQMYQDDDE